MQLTSNAGSKIGSSGCAEGGFLLLIQCRERPERYGEPSRFDTMPSEAKLTRLATAKLVNIIGGYGYRPALIIHAGVHRRGLPRRKNPARRLAAAAGLFSSIIRVSHYKGRLGPIGIRCLLLLSSRSGAYRPG